METKENNARFIEKSVSKTNLVMSKSQQFPNSHSSDWPKNQCSTWKSYITSFSLFDHGWQTQEHTLPSKPNNDMRLK